MNTIDDLDRMIEETERLISSVKREAERRYLLENLNLLETERDALLEAAS